MGIYFEVYIFYIFFLIEKEEKIAKINEYYLKKRGYY